MESARFADGCQGGERSCRDDSLEKLWCHLLRWVRLRWINKNMCVYACGRSNTGHIEFEMSARCAGQDGNSVLVVWV